MATQKAFLYLIKPSQYDDDGYVVRHWRGVLPSNTLACLAALTEDLIRRKRLGDSWDIRLRLYDETVDKVPVSRICRSGCRRHATTIVCLVGVQTNQFPRAADLARSFRRAGLTVMIGGFHVSGYLALLPEIPPDMQQLLDLGVTLVKGEVEETWCELLSDAVNGRLKPVYDFLQKKPDLYDKPIPVVHKKYLRKFVASNFGTLDCGRGCPFDCSFCTIINVQGRKMRFRSADCIADAIRRNYREQGVTFYFFTDDNFARNQNSQAIFDSLICLREIEHIPVQFMMQVDVQSWKIKDFISKASRAGFTNAFIGMESVNPDNLADVGKSQNRVSEYHQLVQAYRDCNISTHVGYIIGFPHDTVDSVRRDLKFLMEEVCPDHASFFLLMPLPGSMDHLHMLQRGEWMHPDFNAYDSQHEVTAHPNLKHGSWVATYLEAWRTFYSFDHMKELLRRASPTNYWNNFFRYLWYKNSIQTEGRHPMMCGFLRMKGRNNVRPGYPILSRWDYYTLRLKELRAQFASMLRLLREMEELWLQTRHPSEAERRVTEEIAKLRGKCGQLKVSDFQAAFQRAKSHCPTLQVPSKLTLFWAKWSPLLVSDKVYTRADLDAFWSTVRQRWTERRIFRIPVFMVPLNLFRDIQLSLLFLFHMSRAL